MAYTDLAHMLADLSQSKTLSDRYNNSTAEKKVIWAEYKLEKADTDVLETAKSADDIRKYLGDAYAKAQMINHW